jgi:hypothetical protein
MDIYLCLEVPWGIPHLCVSMCRATRRAGELVYSEDALSDVSRSLRFCLSVDCLWGLGRCRKLVCVSGREVVVFVCLEKINGGDND